MAQVLQGLKKSEGWFEINDLTVGEINQLENDDHESLFGFGNTGCSQSRGWRRV